MLRLTKEEKMKTSWRLSGKIAITAERIGTLTEPIVSRLFLVCILLSPLTLTGCASHSEIVKKQLDSSAKQFVGKSADDLLMKKGAPDFKEKLSTDDIVWTYRSQKTGRNKGWTMTMTAGREKQGSSQSSFTWYETVNFIIGADGIVKKYSTSVD
jgi:hypothetical protein